MLSSERSGVIVMFLYKSRAQHVLQWPLLGRDPREYICLLWLCGLIFVFRKTKQYYYNNGFSFPIDFYFSYTLHI